MKKTAKKRKLEYIREKNHYRRGGKIGSFFKISNEMLDDRVFIERLTMERTEETKERLERKFKIKFKLVSMVSGNEGQDFTNDLTTIKLTFQKL